MMVSRGTELEKLKLLKRGVYYDSILKPPSLVGLDYRKEWQENALKVFAGSDIVFLDPDNGLLPKSKSKGRKESIKYVFEEEIVDYYISGKSVVFYSHRTRENVPVYLKRFEKLFHHNEFASRQYEQ